MKNFLRACFCLFALLSLKSVAGQTYYPFDAKDASIAMRQNEIDSKLVGICYCEDIFDTESFLGNGGAFYNWNFYFLPNNANTQDTNSLSYDIYSARLSKGGWVYQETTANPYSYCHPYLSEVNIGVDEKIIGSKEVGLLVIADPKFQKFIEDHPGDLNLCFELFKSNNISSVIDITSIIGTTINKEFWRFRLKSNTSPNISYTAIVDANDKTFSSLVTEGTTSVNDQKTIESYLKIYPNPASSNITVQLNNEFLPKQSSNRLEIFSIDGRQIDFKTINSNSPAEIDCTNMQVGKYFIRLSIDGKTITKAFTIEK